MDGVEISARFAFPPNSRKYCGAGTFSSAFANYMARKNAANRMALENEIRKFKAHYEYLKLIAKANGLQPFDEKVCEAFWLGNELLANVKRKDLQRLILKRFCGKGMLSRKRAAALAGNMPGGFVAHHSFHTFYIHTISGVIEPSVKNADLCRVGWGTIIGMRKEEAVLQSQRLVKRKGKLALVLCKRKVATVCNGMTLVPNLKKGDWVAFHWNAAVMQLTLQKIRRLEKCTEQNIAAANKEKSSF